MKSATKYFPNKFFYDSYIFFTNTYKAKSTYDYVLTIDAVASRQLSPFS
jgi:hypothetical protein